VEGVNLASHSDKQIELALLSCAIAAPQFAPRCGVQLCSVSSAALVQPLEMLSPFRLLKGMTASGWEEFVFCRVLQLAQLSLYCTDKRCS